MPDRLPKLILCAEDLGGRPVFSRPEPGKPMVDGKRRSDARNGTNGKVQDFTNQAVLNQAIRLTRRGFPSRPGHLFPSELPSPCTQYARNKKGLTE